MRRRFFCRRSVAVLLVSAARLAFAQQTEYVGMFDRSDALEPYTDATYSYDDNIFRFPDVLLTGQPTGDSSWKREAGVTLDKIISHQHFTGNLDIYKVTFDRFNQIDYTGKDAFGNWNWAIFGWLSGDIGASYSESLTPYSQFHTEQLNLRTEKRNYFDENWMMTPRWGVRAAVSEDKLEYQLDSEKSLNRDQHIANVGIDYLSPLGNKLGFTLQHEKDEFPVPQPDGPFLIDNGYTETEFLGDIDYTLNPFVHVHLTAGWLRWAYNEFSQRNTTGPTAALNVYVTPTPITTISASVWHGVSAVPELTTNYSVNEGVSIAPVWNMADKVQLGAMLREERLEYANEVLGQALPTPQRIDIMRSASVSLLYTPARRLLTSLVVYTDRLDSTESANQYRDRGAALSAKWTF